MSQSQKKLVDYSDESDEELTNDHDRKSPNPSEASSTSQRDNNADNGYCSVSGSQESPSQNRSYKTKCYEIKELIEMINFLIKNDKILDCCSIDTWQLMKSKRQAHSLLKLFKEKIAPNIAQFLKTMSKIWVEQLLDEFRKALQQAQIPETPLSAVRSPSPISLARTISSSSTDSSEFDAPGSTEQQKSVTSSESLDERIVSDSEEETEIIGPPLFNVLRLTSTDSTASQRLVVEESSQSEIKKCASVTSDIRMRKEISKSAATLSTPSIVSETETEEDEDDVVFIEAVHRSNKTLVEMNLIETSSESDRESSDGPRVEQETRNSPNVLTNAEESYPVGTKEEVREENHSAALGAEIPSRIERELKNESQTLTPGTTPLQVDSSCRINNDEHKEPIYPQSTISPIIADSDTNTFDDKELIIEEEPPFAPVNPEPRVSQIDEKLLEECRVLGEKSFLEEPKSSTTPKCKRKLRESVPDGTPNLLKSEFRRSFLQSPKTSNIRVIEEAAISRLNGEPVPSTSGGILGHGFQASEYNHLSRQDDSDRDGDSGFIQTKAPPNVPLHVNKNASLLQGIQTPPGTVDGNFLETVEELTSQQTEEQSMIWVEGVDSTNPNDKTTQFPSVQETNSKASIRKNSRRNVKKSRERSYEAAGSDAYSKHPVARKKRTKDDDPEYKYPYVLRMTKNKRQKCDCDDNTDANSDSSDDLDEVVDPKYLDDEETQSLLAKETRSEATGQENPKRDAKENMERFEEVNATSKSPVSIRREETKREKNNNHESDHQCSHDDDDDNAAGSKSPYCSIRMWERMYGPITVEKRERREPIKFKEDFSMEIKEIPRDSEFSRELLDALHHDMRYNVKINGQPILEDLALLHYFICRPNDILHYKCRPRVFTMISNLKWKIFQDKKINALYYRFYDFIRGYIHQFGLPQEILDIFLYWEWQKSLAKKTKK